MEDSGKLNASQMTKATEISDLIGLLLAKRLYLICNLYFEWNLVLLIACNLVYSKLLRKNVTINLFICLDIGSLTFHGSFNLSYRLAFAPTNASAG